MAKDARERGTPTKKGCSQSYPSTLKKERWESPTNRGTIREREQVGHHLDRKGKEPTIRHRGEKEKFFKRKRRKRRSTILSQRRRKKEVFRGKKTSGWVRAPVWRSVALEISYVPKGRVEYSFFSEK